MGKASGIVYRERIIALPDAGYTLPAIREELGLTYSNVRAICQHYRQEGLAGLPNRYSHCGSTSKRCAPVVYQAAFWLKRRHPRWGTPRLQAGLQTPSIRSLNRWYRLAHLTKPRSTIAAPPVSSSRAVHNIWQVDAKERLCAVGKWAAS